MKRLIVFTLFLLASAGSSYGAGTCSDVAGSFTDNATNPDTYTCTQPAVGSFSCQVALFNSGAYCHMVYTGSGFNSTLGRNNYNAAYSSGTCPPGVFPFSGWLTLSNSCTQMQDSAWTLFFGGGGNVNRQGALNGCEVPGANGNGGENPSAWDGWGTPSGGTGPFNGTWHATLKDISDPNFNFGGRSTTEGAPHITGNSCLPANDPTPNNIWTPEYNNNYSVGDPGDDGVGFPSIVNIIVIQRAYKVILPCTITIHQIMSIDCPTGWQPYEAHDDLITTGNGTFTVSRHGDPHTKSAGATRSVWRWMDSHQMGITR